MTVEHFTPDDLRAFSAAVFASAGLPQDHADIIARDLIKANLRGLDSHGPILFAFPVLLQCLCCSVALWPRGYCDCISSGFSTRLHRYRFRFIFCHPTLSPSYSC